MERIEYIMAALEINAVKAAIINDFIVDIPDAKLKDFFKFRLHYVGPYKSADVTTKEALTDYQRLLIRSRLKKGEPLFQDAPALMHHLTTYYRSRDIVNGAAHFYDYVIIGMNKEGELVNKYRLDPHGNYRRLNSEDTTLVLEWLLHHQERIGDVRFVRVRPTGHQHHLPQGGLV